MTINSPEDIDLLKVVKTLPYGPHRLRAFMLRGEVEVVNSESFVAAVHLTSNGPVFRYSKPMFEKVVEDYVDVAFVTFHELLHVLEGHLDLQGTRQRYRIPHLFEGYDSMDELESADQSSLDREDMATYKVIKYANELEIKHMEHLLLPDEKFHKVNKRLYGDAEEDRNKTLYRESDDISDPLYRIVHKRVFSQGNYSAVETFRVLQKKKDDIDQKMPPMGGGGGEDNSDQEEGDSNQEGNSQDSDDSDDEESQDQEDEEESEDGGGSKEDEEEKNEEQGDGEEDEEEKDNESDQENSGQGDDEEEGKGENSDKDDEQENKGDDNEGEDEESGSSASSGQDPLIESESEIKEDAQEKDVRDLMKAMSDIVDEAEEADGCTTGNVEGKRRDRKVPVVPDQKRKEVESEIRDVRSEPDLQSKLGEILHDRVGSAIQHSVIPNYRDDNRARIDRKLGRFTPKYRHDNRATREKVALYYDCSQSQNAYIPVCNQIVKRYKRFFANQEVYVFGSSVTEIRIGDFVRHVERGTVLNAMKGGRGTSFNSVIRHARENRFQKIAVLTDDKSYITEDLIQPLLQKSQLKYILVLATEDPESHGHDGFVNDGYADQVVQLELDKKNL